MINLRSAKRRLAKRRTECSQLFFRFSQEFHKSLACPQAHSQHFCGGKIQITSFLYIIASSPHYFTLESRYNSFAIPASAGLSGPALQACAIRRLFMAQNVATEQLTIAEWVKGLAAIPVREFTLENVQD